MNKNNIPTQSKFKTNKDRAAFKQECIGALAGIAAKYNVRVEFGPLTERSRFGVGKCIHGMARMEIRICEQESKISEAETSIEQPKVTQSDMRKDITIRRALDVSSVCPRIIAYYKEEQLFNISYELFQDITHGDLSGMFTGRPDRIRSNSEVENIIETMLTNEKSHLKEQILIALRMVRHDMIKRDREQNV